MTSAASTHAAWDDLVVEEVTQGVHRIPLPLPSDGLRAVNVYSIQARDGLTLVDGGWAIPRSMRALEDGLASIGFDIGSIQRVLVTHIHRDHYTQAVALRRRVGATVALGAGERSGLETLRRTMADRPRAALAALRVRGAGELARRLERRTDWDPYEPGDWEMPDRWLHDEDLDVGSRVLEVVPTPGHTQGHVVFLDHEGGLAFTGDHVLPHITPSIGLEEVKGSLSLADFLQSLDRMLDFEDLRLLPAHGPVTPSVHLRVAELIDHHEARLLLCLRAIDSLGSGQAADVAARLPWTRRSRSFAELDDFNRMLAVSETAAHLDVLAVRRQLEARDEDGSRWYVSD